MRTVSGNADIKRANRVKILKYLLDHRSASRLELANALELSSPTVIQIVKDLMERQLVTVVGEYSSTGGRKAKILGIKKGVYYSVGVEITKHHLQLALVDLNHDVVDMERRRYPYQDTNAYYASLWTNIQSFLEKNGISEEKGNMDCILGVGLSIPGVINPQDGTLRRSLILDIKSEINTSRFIQYIPIETYCGRNSDNAAFAEAKSLGSQNVVCLFLNDAVGGSVYLNHEIYVGDRYKGAMIGHIVVYPGGRPCYCGKRGCLNAYCSALALRRSPDVPLSSFFEEMENGNEENARIWDEYLSCLAIGVSNLRMSYECDILLGGDVSEYVKKYQSVFYERLMNNCIFEEDTNYIRFGKYQRGVFAVGAAFVMIEKWLATAALE